LVSSDSKSLGDYNFRGAGGALDLWIGGTPVSGLAMGVALSVLWLDSTRTHVDGTPVPNDVTGSTGLLGYFVDAFPNLERGLHFGGALGLANTTVEVNGDQKFRGGGVGLEAWGGYDFWISPQWSLGGMLRLMGSVSRQDKENVSYETTLGGAALSFTALYH
jgi:hypothetical protein